MPKKIFSDGILNRFNKFIFSTIFVNIVIALFGVIMMFLPDASSKLIGILVGISFLTNGLISIYKYFNRDGAKLYSFNLLFGILSIIASVLLFLYPYSVMEFVVVCLGIYLILEGTMDINYGRWFKIGNEDSWLITIVSGVLLIIFGIIVIINPFAELSVTMVIGLFLLIMAIFKITNLIMLKQRAKEIVKIFW